MEVDGKRKYVPLTQKDLIFQLAKKKILELMLKDTSREHAALASYLRRHSSTDSVGDYLAKEPHIEELVRPLFQIRDERLQKWKEEQYPSTASHMVPFTTLISRSVILKQVRSIIGNISA